ncbi:aconitate hydratase AcnA [Ramlibacter sp. G-1-2-2]|uniref:Aconitate hydratase n=1 Tax=Ramlibacter agri TaxID=2728837 RepID=A0A848H4I2_9BURK|nr:aconitate hydratase AcnA [Ramlibacter agri]NML44441.1 aconitate hydratase AcnA [Ramlibacter agri]
MTAATTRPPTSFLRPVPVPGQQVVQGYSLAAAAPGVALDRLPYCVRVLAENVLRHIGQNGLTSDDLMALLAWKPDQAEPIEVPFHPGRVLMQDYTGIPALVDLATLRNGMQDAGGSPRSVNPQIPVDLVIDHSMVVDVAGRPDALLRNMELEFSRNSERFALAKWAQRTFDNVRVVPPGRGILHQVNIEHIATVVRSEEAAAKVVAFPDTMVGTDSHSTMVNGLGVLGWGVGGIEAEAAMMGLPLVTPLRRVVGVKLTGKLAAGVTATDLVLTLTQRLRAAGVVDAMVEFFGPALASLPVADRATIANMAPEYGSTCALFPIDAATTAYLALTGRSAEQVALVEAYARFQGLWRDAGSVDPAYSDLVALDLSEVQPCVAGPGKPHQKVLLQDVAAQFDAHSMRPSDVKLANGAVVIAAITSCTNTSNPAVMIAAGLLARNAARRGLRSRPWVKTSLTPGSRVVGEYLEAAGLMAPLAELGFHIAGFGCGTCGGNSGPLAPAVEAAIRDQQLHVCSVLSGNRNFEARIHLQVRGNYLMSPPLVVAYAIAGHMGLDLTRDPIGVDSDGQDVHLADIWPSAEEVEQMVVRHVGPAAFAAGYADIFQGDKSWEQLDAPKGELFPWDDGSTYIRRPPYLDLRRATGSETPTGIHGARALLMLGDSITTDHISPAGAIASGSPAAAYLQSRGVTPLDFNSYGSRRSNHEVMVRGTFANTRLRNELVPGHEGGVTRHASQADPLSVYQAAERYAADNVPVVVLAGRDYGAGSSRDWAAKGTRLLGVQAVVAETFERIHRANLANLGVLPLQFVQGQSRTTLGLDGSETFDIDTSPVRPGATVTVRATRASGEVVEFPTRCRLDTASEVEVWRGGGMMPFVLDRLLHQEATA